MREEGKGGRDVRQGVIVAVDSRATAGPWIGMAVAGLWWSHTHALSVNILHYTLVHDVVQIRLRQLLPDKVELAILCINIFYRIV